MSDAAPRATWALRAHAACEWVLWALTMNALWWLFTLAGAVVLGAAPATIAAATLTRRQLRGEKVRALRDFAAVWRAELLLANALLLPLLIPGALLAVTASALLATAGPLGPVSLAAAVLVAAICHIVIPMYVSYDLPLRAYVMTAMRWGVANLAQVLVALAGTALVVGASLAIPGIVPFLSIGAVIVIDTALGCAFFHANERSLAESP
ncbi:DUF624 domain-containing protein [Microbacterium karelineae]|uniref:DUF624 domain-containing protein n=1 Tax=Microbacterium karelineae TaxID=2654283 RepID=UPI0018D4C656|nr:DUF624 domain-containing protein [Microbacterium karelineae]